MKNREQCAYFYGCTTNLCVETFLISVDENSYNILGKYWIQVYRKD